MRKRLRSLLSRDVLSMCHKLYVRSHPGYAVISWCNIPSNRLERMQRKAAKVSLAKVFGITWVIMSFFHHWIGHGPTLSSRRQFLLARMGHSLQYKLLPLHILTAAGEFSSCDSGILRYRLRKSHPLHYQYHWHPLFTFLLCSLAVQQLKSCLTLFILSLKLTSKC